MTDIQCVDWNFLFGLGFKTTDFLTYFLSYWAMLMVLVEFVQILR